MPSAAEQKKVDDLVDKGLKPALDGGMNTLLKWLNRYAGVAWSTEVGNPRGPEIYEALEQLGYKKHDCTGADFVEGDKVIMGRYVIGQIMGYLEKNGYMPNAAQIFTERYLDMPDPQPGKPIPHPGPCVQNKDIKLLKTLRFKPKF